MTGATRWPRFDEVLADPSRFFAHPSEVLAHPDWSRYEKWRVLEQWRLDATALSIAEDESMVGGEHSPLDAVTKAQSEVSAESPGEVDFDPRRHKVAGVYESELLARRAAGTLSANDVRPGNIRILGPDDVDRLDDDENALLAEAGREIAMGAGIGAGIGVAGAAALAAASVSVVVSVPVAAALIAAGVGGVLGCAASGAASTSLREPAFKELLREAIGRGYWITLVEGRSEAQALAAQALIRETAAERTIDQHGAVREQHPPHS